MELSTAISKKMQGLNSKTSKSLERRMNMTNYERIKSMRVEEMAKLLSNEHECERYCAFTKKRKM